MIQNGTFSFEPLIDLPLVAATLAGFLINFASWSKNAEIDTVVDLNARLPTARIRVIAVLSVLLVTCWVADLAVWLLYGFLVAVGSTITLVTGGAPNPGALPLFTANLIREWCFGFPQFILQPHRSSKVPREETAADPMLGCRGTAVSCLRPTGVVELEGQEIQGVSESGTLIETGALVVVTGRRNGLLAVRIVD